MRKQKTDFSVIIERLDISKIEAQLARQLQEAEDDISRINDPEFPEPCYEIPSTGRWEHRSKNHECFYLGCPFEEEQEAIRRLDRLKLLSLPLLCFRDPEKAKDQRTLEGMAQDSCVYRSL